MPVYVDNRVKAAALKDKHYLLNKHIVECYDKLLKKESICALIKQHKRLISQLEIIGKNKPKTLSILLNYASCKDKVMAFSIMTNTLNNRKLFSI